jgi:hypothetical protein
VDRQIGLLKELVHLVLNVLGNGFSPVFNEANPGEEHLMCCPAVEPESHFTYIRNGNKAAV